MTLEKKKKEHLNKEKHQKVILGKNNSIINLNDKLLVSVGKGTYEIFYWDLNNNYNLQKLKVHTNNINYIIIFRYE